MHVHATLFREEITIFWLWIVNSIFRLWIVSSWIVFSWIVFCLYAWYITMKYSWIEKLDCYCGLNVFLGRTRPFLSVKNMKWAPFLSKGTTSQHRARLYGPSLMNTLVKVYHDITYSLPWLACFVVWDRDLGVLRAQAPILAHVE